MTLVIPNTMKQGFLQAIKLYRLQNVRNPVLCGLYVTDVTPTVESVAADFFQPSYSNYVPMKPTGWSNCYINLAGNAETDADPLVWTTADEDLVPFTVYGYFLWDTYQNLLWAELLEGGPVEISMFGQSIALLLSLTYGACEAMSSQVAKVEKGGKAPPKKVAIEKADREKAQVVPSKALSMGGRPPPPGGSAIKG